MKLHQHHKLVLFLFALMLSFVQGLKAQDWSKLYRWNGESWKYKWSKVDVGDIPGRANVVIWDDYDFSDAGDDEFTECASLHLASESKFVIPENKVFSINNPKGGLTLTNNTELIVEGTLVIQDPSKLLSGFSSESGAITCRGKGVVLDANGNQITELPLPGGGTLKIHYPDAPPSENLPGKNEFWWDGEGWLDHSGDHVNLKRNNSQKSLIVLKGEARFNQQLTYKYKTIEFNDGTSIKIEAGQRLELERAITIHSSDPNHVVIENHGVIKFKMPRVLISDQLAKIHCHLNAWAYDGNGHVAKYLSAPKRNQLIIDYDQMFAAPNELWWDGTAWLNENGGYQKLKREDKQVKLKVLEGVALLDKDARFEYKSIEIMNGASIRIGAGQTLELRKAVSVHSDDPSLISFDVYGELKLREEFIELEGSITRIYCHDGAKVSDRSDVIIRSVATSKGDDLLIEYEKMHAAPGEVIWDGSKWVDHDEEPFKDYNKANSIIFIVEEGSANFPSVRKKVRVKGLKILGDAQFDLLPGQSLEVLEMLAVAPTATLTLTENESNYSQLYVHGGGIIKGAINVERYIAPVPQQSSTDDANKDSQAWWFLGAPTSGVTWQSLCHDNAKASKYGLFSFDENWQWENGDDELIPGKGYVVYLGAGYLLDFNENSTLTAKGEIVNEDVEVKLFDGEVNPYPNDTPAEHPDGPGGWNFVSNPYPCEMSLVEFFKANREVISPHAYVLVHEHNGTDGGEGYYVGSHWVTVHYRNRNGGRVRGDEPDKTKHNRKVIHDEKYLRPWQGLMVRDISNGTGSVRFTPEMRRKP